jgi:hypothetical protein
MFMDLNFGFKSFTDCYSFFPKRMFIMKNMLILEHSASPVDMGNESVKLRIFRPL